MNRAEEPELRVLTVCLGNVCRSPLMERLLALRLPGAVVTSAGLQGLTGRPIEPNASAELVRLGGNGEGFVARRLRPEYAEQADLILTATVPIRSAVLEEVPSALRRTFTLLELAALSRQAPGVRGRELIARAAAHRRLAAGEALDIVDPMGRSPEVHREAAAMIDSATADVAEALRFEDHASGHA